MIQWPNKDPEDIVNYGLDWTTWLAGDTIATAEFEITQGTVSIVSQSHDTTKALCRLSGGTLGELAKLVCTITTTTSEETKQETCLLRIKEA